MRFRNFEILYKLSFVCVTSVSKVACPSPQEHSVSTPTTCTRVTEPKVLPENENKYLRGYVFHYLERATVTTCGLRYREINDIL